MTDIFLRPVTDGNVVYLYDPLVADEAAVVVVSGGGGGGGVSYIDIGSARFAHNRRIREEKLNREDEEVLSVIAAFMESLAA